MISQPTIWRWVLVILGGILTVLMVLTGTSQAQTYDFMDWGTLIYGIEAGCVLFKSDHFGKYVLDDRGGYGVGTRLLVFGNLAMHCYSICMEGNGCIKNTMILAVDSVTAVGESEDSRLLPRFHLGQNSPNPFNAGTVIQYTTGRECLATLDVFDILGRKVRTLVEEVQTAGVHEINWDGANDHGRPVASGVYLYRLQAGDYSESKKMVLLK